MIDLVPTKKCFGCLACASICPKKAIDLVTDGIGFVYPKLEIEKCVRCGKCLTVCPALKEEKNNRTYNAFYALNNNENIGLYSSSSGAFYSIAEDFIVKGGVVYGCTLTSDLKAKHIRIEKEEDLKLLQKSKYVQSSIIEVYAQAKKDLIDGRYVLFSGTPCQIQAIKLLTSGFDEKLYTIDLICHGVPSQLFFDSFISFIEKKKNIKIENYYFRHTIKNLGSYYTRIEAKKNGKKTRCEKVFPWQCLSYSYYFMNNYSIRQSCFECKFRTNHCSDITLGDCWEFERITGTHNVNGVSKIVVNTNKGNELKRSIERRMTIKSLNLEESNQNDIPSKPKDIDHFYNIYMQKGYKGVYHLYRKKAFIRRFISSLLLKMHLFINR